jgi:hypothetical protein
VKGQDGKNVMVYEKDIPFLTLLHAGDPVDYLVKKTMNGIKAINIKEVVK